MWIQLLCACVLYSMGHVNFYAQIWAFVTSISHMGEMRDSDWSRQNLLRSDWLPINVALYTTEEFINIKVILFLILELFRWQNSSKKVLFLT